MFGKEIHKLDTEAETREGRKEKEKEKYREEKGKDIPIDILAFSPHPDDAELGAGGFLLEMRNKGYTTGIIDLTKGEMGSTASSEVRLDESKKAAELLDLTIRYNANLGDCRVTDSYENRLAVANILRKYKPKIVLAPYFEDRHPDHVYSSLLVKHALVYARLKKLGEPHYVTSLFYYMLNTPFEPTFIVDITASFDRKIEVLSCYTTQFSTDFPYLKDYIPHIAAKAVYYGSLIQAKYGEPFRVEGFLRISDPITL